MNNVSKKNINVLKWISGGIEAILGIPFIGGIFILSMSWSPLFIMMAVHIIIIILVLRNKQNFPTGNVIGLGASILGFIPGVGMVLHIIAAVFILMEAGKAQSQLNLQA